MRKRSALLCCVLTLVGIGSAAADTLTVTETTLANGYFFSFANPGKMTPFTNALLTLTYMGNASNTHVFFQNGQYDSSNFGGAQTISVAGLGTSTSPAAAVGDTYGFITYLSSNSVSTLGSIGTDSQSADGQGDQLISTTAASGPYTLANSFGPITGTSSYFVGGFTYGHPGFSFDNGLVQFTNFDPSITYQATVTPIAATPEPYSLLLVATGLCGIAGTARRRYARTHRVPLKGSEAW